jgi:hypothetical protein
VSVQKVKLCNIINLESVEWWFCPLKPSRYLFFSTSSTAHNIFYQDWNRSLTISFLKYDKWLFQGKSEMSSRTVTQTVWSSSGFWMAPRLTCATTRFLGVWRDGFSGGTTTLGPGKLQCGREYIGPHIRYVRSMYLRGQTTSASLCWYAPVCSTGTFYLKYKSKSSNYVNIVRHNLKLPFFLQKRTGKYYFEIN